MFQKSFIFVSILVFGSLAGFSQTSGERAEKTPQTFAFSFDGDGGYLGVQTREVTKDNFAKFGLRDVRGVAVESVVENSPAAAAGIKDGDVIVRFNGEDVTSARKLTRLVGEVDPDHQAKLTVLRNGKEQEIVVTIGKRPSPKAADGNFSYSFPDGFGNLEKLRDLPELKDLPNLKDVPEGQFKEFKLPNGQGYVYRAGSKRQIGVAVYPITKQLGDKFGVESGVLINDVREQSPAFRAGLKAGDIIVEADGKPVKNEVDLVNAINGKKEGDVVLIIMRDRNRQTISVSPETVKGSPMVFGNEGLDGIRLPAPAVVTPGVRQTMMPIPSVPLPAISLFGRGRII